MDDWFSMAIVLHFFNKQWYQEHIFAQWDANLLISIPFDSLSGSILEMPSLSEYWPTKPKVSGLCIVNATPRGL